MRSDSIEQILLTDLDGESVEYGDVEDLAYCEVDDDRRFERIPHLIKLLNDSEVDPFYRFLACWVLVVWADEAGYSAAMEACRNPGGCPWYGVIVDRWFSADETFSHMAEALVYGRQFADSADRLDAWSDVMRAVVSIADREYFDWRLAMALGRWVGDPPAEAIQAVSRGIARVRGDDHLGFHLGRQLADIIVSLFEMGHHLAFQMAVDLAACDNSRDVLIRLLPMVRTGSPGDVSGLREYLAMVGNQEIRAHLGT